MRNVGLKDKATVEEALKELAAVKEQVAEESKPEVVHVPANLVLLKRDDILREGELVVVRACVDFSGRLMDGAATCMHWAPSILSPISSHI